MEQNQVASQTSTNTSEAELEREPVSLDSWPWIPCNNMASSDPEAAEQHLF